MTQKTKNMWLIGGDNCSLCDVASDVLDLAFIENQDVVVDISYVNVKSTTLLFHLYGARIPVLLDTESDVALYWPFELSQVQEFIRS